MPDKKIPISEFCEMFGKTKRHVRHLFTIHPKLKVKVAGERSRRVNLTLWEKIVERA